MWRRIWLKQVVVPVVDASRPSKRVLYASLIATLRIIIIIIIINRPFGAVGEILAFFLVGSLGQVTKSLNLVHGDFNLDSC